MRKTSIDPLTRMARRNQFNELVVFVEANKLGEEFVDFAYRAKDDQEVLDYLKKFYYLKTTQAFEEIFNEESLLMDQPTGIEDEILD